MRIFLSYRREDSAALTGRIGDRLVREFGAGSLFLDVESIPLGANFLRRLSDEVARSNVLLAVIGQAWLDLRDANGQRRLDDAEDLVRFEIREALTRGITVIPILSDGVTVPKAELLPDDIQGLAFCNGLAVRHASFHKDLDKLVAELRLRAPKLLVEAEPSTGLDEPEVRWPVARKAFTLLLTIAAWLFGSALGFAASYIFLVKVAGGRPDRLPIATHFGLGIGILFLAAVYFLFLRDEYDTLLTKALMLGFLGFPAAFFLAAEVQRLFFNSGAFSDPIANPWLVAILHVNTATIAIWTSMQSQPRS